MKLIALVMLLLAGTAWADDMDRYLPPGPDGRILGILTMDGKYHTIHPETFKKAISEWAASGEVCRVLGHRWKYLHVIIPTGEIRECSICGKTETKKEVWE